MLDLFFWWYIYVEDIQVYAQTRLREEKICPTEISQNVQANQSAAIILELETVIWNKIANTITPRI